MTGRYILDKESPFLKIVDNLENNPYTAIVRFNQYDKDPSLVKSKDCITGLIGMKCEYVKKIEVPPIDNILISVEMKWVEVINELNDSEICFLDKLGIYIKPKMLWNNDYLYV
jgi:hypothetical protein